MLAMGFLLTLCEAERGTKGKVENSGWEGRWVLCSHVPSSEGGSLHLCRLRTMSVGPCCNKHWLCTRAYETYGGPTNLVASMVVELDDNLPHFMDDRRDSVWATHRLPFEVLTWKTALGRGRAGHDSLIVIAKGGHSCYLHGLRVSYCQVISLARWPLIWVSVTPSDMGEACSLSPNVAMGSTLWWIWWFMDDIDYFVVMAGCYVDHYLSYLCMISIGCKPILPNQLNLANNPA
jgi:hypothetical protein